MDLKLITAEVIASQEADKVSEEAQIDCCQLGPRQQSLTEGLVEAALVHLTPAERERANFMKWATKEDTDSIEDAEAVILHPHGDSPPDDLEDALKLLDECSDLFCLIKGPSVKSIVGPYVYGELVRLHHRVEGFIAACEILEKYSKKEKSK